MELENISNQVFELVEKIPVGKISTYGRIGGLLNIGPRQVGWILHRNNDPKKFPCHRVIKADGKMASGYAFGGPDNQAKKLKKEGVIFKENNVVDLKKCLCNFPDY